MCYPIPDSRPALVAIIDDFIERFGGYPRIDLVPVESWMPSSDTGDPGNGATKKRKRPKDPAEDCAAGIALRVADELWGGVNDDSASRQNEAIGAFFTAALEVSRRTGAFVHQVGPVHSWVDSADFVVEAAERVVALISENEEQRALLFSYFVADLSLALARAGHFNYEFRAQFVANIAAAFYAKTTAPIQELLREEHGDLRGFENRAFAATT